MGNDADTAGRSPIGGYKLGIAPSVSFGLGTPTRLTLGYYHLYSSDMPDYSARIVKQLENQLIYLVTPYWG